MSKFRLPDGTVTSSAEEYTARWRELGSVIEGTFGWRLYAFNPHLSFQDVDKNILFFPVEAVQQINATIQDYDQQLSEAEQLKKEREEVGQRATELLLKYERLSVEADIVRAELHQAKQERDQAIALNKAAALLLTKGWERKGEP